MSNEWVGAMRWVARVCAAMALFVEPALAHADCMTAAKAQLKSMRDVVVEQATLDDAAVAGTNAKCSNDKACQIIRFHNGSDKPPEPKAPDGFTPNGDGWKPVGTLAAAPECTDLQWFVFQKSSTQPAPKPGPDKSGDRCTANPKTPYCQSRSDLRAVGADENDSSRAAPGPDDAHRAEDALRAFKRAPHSYTTLPGQGPAQGAFDDAAAEALQILGQIVVDRASGKAYELLRDRFKQALKCGNDEESSKTDFPATCAVLKTLRLQDVAMAPHALANALGADLLELLTRGDQTQAALTRGLYAVTSSLFTNVGQPEELAVMRTLGILADYVKSITVPVGSLTNAQQAALFGELTLARCVADSDGSSASVANCNVGDVLTTLNAPEAVRPAAGELAQKLIAIVSASKSTRARVQLALDTAAETACMLMAQPAEAIPRLVCPAIESLSSLGGAARPAFAKAFADAALNEDAMRFTVVAAALVDILWAKQAAASEAANDEAAADRHRKKSALRLLAGLLDYAATYAKDPSGTTTSSADELHQQRTKILESLTADMTDRTGREGDGIFALGGSLRGMAGVRFAVQTKGVTFYGPLSLPLGLAYSHVPTGKRVGFHIQLNAIDLGNYLALEKGPNVKTPQVGDALAPGLSVGFACGRTLPFVVTLDGSYTPQFRLDPSKPDKHGSINVGVAFGIFVPLFDLN